MNNIDVQLAQLETAQLVRRLPEEELTYMFKHALTQETAQASLLKKARHTIHSQVAQAIETQYADRLDEYAALLTQHYAAAEDDPKTLEYATRAGDANARQSANAEAVAHYSIAIESAKRIHAPIHDLYVKRGRALELLGNYSEALASYEEMESLAREQNDDALELTSLAARAALFSTHTPLHDGERGEAFSEQALAVARKIGDRFAEARILWTQMLYHIYSSGNGQAAVKLGEQSLRILRELSATPPFAQNRQVREQLAFTLNDLLYAYSQVAELARGLNARLEARDLWRELDNKPMLADNLAGVGLAQWAFGDASTAVITGDEGFAIAESISNPWGMAQGRLVKGHALAELGRFAEAIAAFSEGDQYATAAKTGGAMLGSRCGLALCYHALGIYADGLKHAQRALDAALQYLPDWHLWPRAVLIRLYLARGDLASAQLIAQESKFESSDRKIFRAFMPGVAAIILADAELAIANKNYARAIQVTDSAFDYLSGTAPNYLPDLYYLRAQAFLGMNARAEARRAMLDTRTALKKSRRVRWLVLGAASAMERADGNVVEANRLRDEARAEVRFIADNLNAEMQAQFLALPLVLDILAVGQF